MQADDDGIKLIHLAETGSTNSFMQMVAANEGIASGSIVLADFQTAGRGQKGNSWESEAGQNLTFSVFFRPEDLLPAGQMFYISEIASLSVKRTLDKYLPDISVKWPNDIYWKDKKIAGMLIENSLQNGLVESSVIGIGLNVNQRKFAGGAPNPVSMAQIAGKAFDRLEIIEEFRQNFAETSRWLKDKERLHENYCDALYRKGGFYEYSDGNGVFEAEIVGVGPDGRIALRRRDGTLSRYAFKEVAFRI